MAHVDPAPSEHGPVESQTLPKELVGPAPRELPDSVKSGRLAQRRRQVFWGCMTAGGLCAAIAPLPFVDTLALYVLPLGYLTWIAVGLAVIGAANYFVPAELNKACRYIREGQTAFARVCSLVKTPTVLVEGQVTTYAFVAQVELLHPETGEPVQREVKSRDFPAGEKDQTDTRFRVGDAVPVVWLPGRFDKTLQIYDFLEATPESSLVRRTVQSPLWKTILLVAAIPLIFFALFWNIYAFGRYSPPDFDYLRQGIVPMAIGGTVGLAVLLLSAFATLKRNRQRVQRNTQAAAAGEAIELQPRQNALRTVVFGLALTAGAILLSGATVLGWCFTANALFDRSEPKFAPVLITNMTQTTHAFLFREYELEYRFLKSADSQKMLTTPQHLGQFAAQIGLARLREGWLGWQWVETVEPALVVDPFAKDQP